MGGWRGVVPASLAPAPHHGFPLHQLLQLVAPPVHLAVLHLPGHLQALLLAPQAARLAGIHLLVPHLGQGVGLLILPTFLFSFSLPGRRSSRALSSEEVKVHSMHFLTTQMSTSMRGKVIPVLGWLLMK